MTPDRIETDSALDIVSGASGAILALLALYDATDDKEFLQQSVACGEHLLANLVGRDGFDEFLRIIFVRTWKALITVQECVATRFVIVFPQAAEYFLKVDIDTDRAVVGALLVGPDEGGD